MEHRHTEIREGAGLEEARINREFVDFLQRWGGWILIGFALIALAYAGVQKLDQMRRAGRDNAFLALNEAIESGNPQGLVRVAQEHSVGVVPHMARLEAADIWLESARTGLTPGDLYEVGSTGNWDGVIPETSQDFDPAEGLKQAESLYQQVVDDTRRDARHRELALSGLFGLAAVAESRGEKEAAAEHYRAAKELAEAGKMPDLVAEAQARLDSLETLQLVSLPARDDLYQPEPEVPETAPLAPPITPIPGEVTPEDEAAAESMIGGEEPAAVEPAPVDDPEQAEDETDSQEPAETDPPAEPAPTP